MLHFVSNSLNILSACFMNVSYKSSEYEAYIGTLLSTKSTEYSLGIGAFSFNWYESSYDSAYVIPLIQYPKYCKL